MLTRLNRWLARINHRLEERNGRKAREVQDQLWEFESHVARRQGHIHIRPTRKVSERPRPKPPEPDKH